MALVMLVVLIVFMSLAETYPWLLAIPVVLGLGFVLASNQAISQVAARERQAALARRMKALYDHEAKLESIEKSLDAAYKRALRRISELGDRNL